MALIDKLAGLNIDVFAATHGAGHALLGLTPIYVMANIGEVKTICRESRSKVARYDSIYGSHN